MSAFQRRIPGDPARRSFAGMLAKLDESVGVVVRALAETGMLNETVLVCTTDNGGPADGFDFNKASKTFFLQTQYTALKKKPSLLTGKVVMFLQFSPASMLYQQQQN